MVEESKSNKIAYESTDPCITSIKHAISRNYCMHASQTLILRSLINITHIYTEVINKNSE